ncbi:MAG: hypothetical protein QM682_17505 [Paracoccus sp. (in: a-proteobacteria)]|uniref:hypothetical protein n=1 Tax=Paracoccus sp. TaxID=267 RepID=UPI0039E267A5
MAESGHKPDMAQMVRGTALRYIVRTGTGGIFAGFGKTFFGQSGANYVRVSAGAIVAIAYDSSMSYAYLTVTPVSRADRTSHDLGATAVREAQLTAISKRTDCTQGCEQYDLSGEGGLDVHLSPKGYFTGDYRLFRAWHNAVNGGGLSLGPAVSAVTLPDDTTVRITLTGARRRTPPTARHIWITQASPRARICQSRWFGRTREVSGRGWLTGGDPDRVNEKISLPKLGLVDVHFMRMMVVAKAMNAVNL